MLTHVNVSGLRNNCGAFVFLHQLLDHWAVLPFRDNAGLNRLLENIHQECSVPNDPGAIYEMAQGLSYLDQEVILGPVVRRHMASQLSANADYTQGLSVSFVTEMVNALSANPGLNVNDKIRKPNVDFFNTMQTEFALFCSQDEHAHQDSSKNRADFLRANQHRIRDYWHAQGLNNVINYIGSNEHCYEFTIEELLIYAQSLNIALTVYHNDHLMAANPSHIPDPFFSMTVHNAGAHWTYEAAAHIDEAEILRRNQSIRDLRDNPSPVVWNHDIKKDTDKLSPTAASRVINAVLDCGGEITPSSMAKLFSL
jgi:hypothetical protein